MRFLALGIVLSFAPLLKAQTVVASVVDAASFSPRVTPGALATIFGSNLANGTQGASSLPLPQSIAGATVLVNRATVPLLYVSKTQINFQVPSNLAAGTASMVVSRDGGTSPTFQFTVTPSAPAMFQDASNHAIAQNAADFSTNSSTNPVASGDVVVVYLTGQGAVDNAVADGTATPASPVSTAKGAATATIGGVDATVNFVGLTPGFVGLAQANIVVPALATADYPLVLTVGGFVSTSAMISVSGSGTAPPKFLTQVGQLNFAGGLSNSLAIFGNTTYVCGPDRINIVNTSNVSAPTLIGEFGDADLAGNGGKCVLNTATSRPILLVLVGPPTSPTFAIYDLSNPNNPVKIVQQTTAPYVYISALSFLGKLGFGSTSWFATNGTSITSQNGVFFSVDLSTLFPVFVSVLTSGPGSSGSSILPNSLALLPGNYPNTAYITSTTSSGSNTSGIAALDIVDISHPQAMQGVRQVTVSSASVFLGFGYDADLLMVTGNTSGLRNPGVPDFNIDGNLTISTMNIANVQNPAGIANITTQIPTTGTYVVQPFGSDVFAIVNNPPGSDPGGPSNIMIVDAGTPSAPVLYPFISQFGMSDIGAVNGYLLVPNVNGLTIYKIQLP
jgi:uncharacterized protein (TIGR03437 family)